jgi:hypothetical protein
VAAALAALLANMELGTRDTAVRKAGLEKTRVFLTSPVVFLVFWFFYFCPEESF